MVRPLFLNTVIVCMAVIMFSYPVYSNEVRTRQSQSQQTVSPVRGIIHQPNRALHKKARSANNINPGYRTFDGSQNHLEFTEMGATHTQLLRVTPADYSDNISAMAGTNRPGARYISNTVMDQTISIPNAYGITDFLWQWGQFLDHDIDLTDGIDPPEPEYITIPTGDIYFDPANSGNAYIAFNRSIYDPTSIPRQQINEITAWIDASNVYGSDEERANSLRTFAGDGKLKTSEGDLLPFNVDGLPNAGGDNPGLFLAGDVRANEQAGLAAMHTLFVREHNRLAELISRKDPNLTGEEIYQEARQLVGAEMQVVTYREFLPALLGRNALKEYRGYDPTVDASIVNSFSSAAFRWGHSALSPMILRLDQFGNEIPEGHLPLRHAFFNPDRLTDEGGIEPLLRGLASQRCQKIDNQIIPDVRNFLFGEPASGGFDLASLNIQRGRDHGLPSYNNMRIAYGFTPAFDFSDISSDIEVQQKLADAYDSVDDVDLWVGGLSEDPVAGAHLGPLFHTMVKYQFEALRDGDRFWYQLTLSRKQQRYVESLSLADIIRLNTSIDDEIQNNVFSLRKSRNRKRR